MGVSGGLFRPWARRVRVVVGGLIARYCGWCKGDVTYKVDLNRDPGSFVSQGRALPVVRSASRQTISIFITISLSTLRPSQKHE